MLIEIINVVTVQRNGHKIKGRRCIFKCDFCDKELIRPYKYRNAQYVFCDKKCANQSQKSGVLKEKKEQTCFEHYGVTCSFQSPVVKEKITQTLQTKYGVDFISQIEEVKIKKEKTFTIRYGAPHPLQSSILRDRLEQRMLVKYGIKNALNHGPIRDKINLIENAHKAHETRKRNGTFRKSRAEDVCYNHLVELFNTENVIRQKLVKNWAIDFYIQNINTYVQLDGVYWHGLNRPIEEILKYKTPRDVQIYKKYLTDREQDCYFNENNLKLVRVTDIEIYANPTILIERLGMP